MAILKQERGWVLAFIAGLIIVLLMVAFLPAGYDYEEHYRPVTERLLAGETRLYDDASRGYYNAPWMLLLFIPISFLGFKLATLLLLAAMVGAILLSTRAAQKLHPAPGWAVVLALLNWFLFGLLFLGQVDWLLLVGVVLGWWAITERRPLWLSLALWLLAAKPLNVLLIGLLFVWSVRRWTTGELVRVFSLPVISLLLTFPLFGFDWPQRYIDNFGADPPDELLSATIWKSADAVGLSHIPFIVFGILAGVAFLAAMWRVGLSSWTISLALVTNFTFTTYAYGHHYVLLIPAFLFVASQKHHRMTLLIYAFSWSPVFRGVIGDNEFLIDIFYPILLLFALWQVKISGEDDSSSNVEVVFDHP